MSNTDTTLTIKMPKKLRDETKKTAKDLGIPVTTAINAMARKFVRDRALTLEADCPFPSHTPNAETRKALREARDPKKWKTMSSAATVEEMFEDILGKRWRQAL